MMINHQRRRLLAAGFALTPLAAVFSSCGRPERWPAGMRPIKWDRDTCTQCRMVISDRRFAVEMCSGTSDALFKFDDIGCAMVWQRDKAKAHSWMAEPATRLWVADLASKGDDAIWLDARAAHYVNKTSPMGYNFGASAHDQPGAMDFQTMREHVLARKE
ncbi:MAG: nitrous oxide reductase accessory protein NosL [Burkholderiaceae bacterium]|jgi:nitrous oxide reductase accessory protein NosL|nr:nitrous oxide reductase accessory protein NosL [Burkholderiaceae bacterium]